MTSVNYAIAKAPEMGRWDVLVCGGGPAGVTAALSAARQGMRVLLVEAKHQVGGMGTSGMVSHWLGGRTNDGRWVVGGLYGEFVRETREKGISVVPDPADYADVSYAPYGLHKGQLLAGVPFDPFRMAAYLEQKLVDAGVDVLFETTAVDVVVEEQSDGRNRVQRVIVAGKDGLGSVAACVVVDATGDADVAALTGCRYEKGAEREGLSPISLIFHVENVDEAALMAYVIDYDDPRYRKLLPRLREQGVECFNYQWMIFVKMNRSGYFMINGRILEDVDGTDARSRTRGYIVERGKIDGTVELYREHFPGCRDLTLRAVASNLGVRETRRIEALRTLTVQDVTEGTRFPDTVGYSSYGWDLLSRDGTDPMRGVAKPPVVPIPLSVMIPKAVDNLICPGRAVGAERVVLGPIRVQAPVMAIGEAAGVCAALAARSGAPLASIDPDTVRGKLELPGEEL